MFFCPKSMDGLPLPPPPPPVDPTKLRLQKWKLSLCPLPKKGRVWDLGWPKKAKNNKMKNSVPNPNFRIISGKNNRTSPVKELVRTNLRYCFFFLPLFSFSSTPSEGQWERGRKKKFTNSTSTNQRANLLQPYVIRRNTSRPRFPPLFVVNDFFFILRFIVADFSVSW